MVKLLVLAGGAGTRLKPAVSDVPKPLAPVAGKPFLHFLMQSWLGQGITDITFLLHHQANLMKEFLQTQPQGAFTINTIVEPKPLGTGGALAFAVRQLSLTGKFLVANADTWLGTGMGELLSTPAPSMATVKIGNLERYGSITVENKKITSFAEKRSGGEGWINAGLYHLDSAMFGQSGDEAFSLERDIFPGLVQQKQLSAVELHTDFIDIGIPEDYFRFCRWIESGKTCPL